MKNYKIILQYDGGRYDGWQKQGNTENTIQERLESVLSAIAGVPTEIFGSGRTDAGTHALGQVANFKLDWVGTSEELLAKINQALPEDIAVLGIEEASPRFHSRLNAQAKTYEYVIWNDEKSPVFWRKYSFRCEKVLDLEKMKTAAEYFVGEHDFMSFCANKRMKKSTVRKIYDITFTKMDGRIHIAFHGNGFLYQMVRIIVGTLIEVGEGKRTVEEIPEIMAARNREVAGFTAPSRGLFLKEVCYDEKRQDRLDRLEKT